MFRLAETIRRIQTNDGGVLLDVHFGQMYRLNAVGSRIVELLENGFDEGQISAEISKVYAMNAETISADVRDFIAKLNQHHLLRLGGEP